MTFKAALLLILVIGGGVAIGIFFQRRHTQAKLAIRKELAELGSARITVIRQDNHALVGHLNGFPYKLYNFDKGRGGVYLRIELTLPRPSERVIQIKSGIPGALANGGRKVDSEFWSRFTFHGDATDRYLFEDADLQNILLAIWQHAGSVEIEVSAAKLVCDWADHGYSATKEMMDLLIQLTWLARSVSE